MTVDVAVGDVVTAIRSWRRRPLIIGAGAALIAAGWLNGLLAQDRR
jgi:hypothetical protein